MKRHFIFILLFLVCLLVSSPAEARLTLGVLVGTDEASGEISSEQVRTLASMLAEKLQEKVVVKEMSDSATLINWLDRFAALDLALLSAKAIESNRGKFLLLGSVDEQGKFNLVSRRGAEGDLPQRVARVVRESGFVPWKLSATIKSQAKQVEEESPPSVELKPTTIDEVIASQAEPQHVPLLRPGRAWAPQEERVYRDILPSDEPLLKKLVLGVVPDPRGLLQTSEQAASLVAYLEEVLPVSVKVRDFTRIETFTEWFMRHRMIDIAVLSPAIAKANLGRDYQPVVKLFRTDRPGEESAELVVVRRGQAEEVQTQLQRVFLDMALTAEGQALLAGLKISEVLVPNGVSGHAPVVAQPAVIDQPQKRLSPPVYAELIKPLAPSEVIVKALPRLPETDVPTPALPVPEMSSLDSSLPALKTAPVEPPVVSAVPVVTPKRIVPELVPYEPVMAAAPPLPQAAVVPELVVPVEPPVVSAVPVVMPKRIVPEPVPDEPVMAAVPPLPPAAVVPEPVALPNVDQPEVPSFVETVIPREPELPMDTSVEPDFESESVADNEQQKIIEEVMAYAEVVPAHEPQERNLPVIDANENALSDDEILSLLGEDTVAAVVAQPDIPPELRPPGIPVIRPGRIKRRTTAAEDELLVASIPEPRRKTDPAQLPKLLPESEPEPGIVYVLPFAAVMVPEEVRARIFDQFVDTLNLKGEALSLQFVILKKGLQQVTPEWLAVRKYVIGEIYAYVEDSGSNWTELRSKARLAYRSPDQNVPAFNFEYPVKRFFDRDRSTIDIERTKLSDDISATLSSELLKALQN